MSNSQLPPKRILLVDDEKSVRISLKLLLTHDGHEVVTADSGIQGLQEFVPDLFDIVITDYFMPGMPGSEFAAAVKQIAPDMPVIMLTAFPPRIKPSSVDLILTKPFMLVHLRQGMRQLTTPRAVADTSS